MSTSELRAVSNSDDAASGPSAALQPFAVEATGGEAFSNWGYNHMFNNHGVKLIRFHHVEGKRPLHELHPPTAAEGGETAEDTSAADPGSYVFATKEMAERALETYQLKRVAGERVSDFNDQGPQYRNRHKPYFTLPCPLFYPIYSILYPCPYA